MIDAYLDESGIHDGATVCVIAGYCGGPGQMKRFDRGWRETLAAFKFPMKDFHAKDLLKSRDARPMLEALAKVSGAQPELHPVAYGIVVDDFNSFSVDERRFLTGATLMGFGKLVTSGCPSKPYFAPFQSIIRVVTDYAPIGGKANFFFGLGRPFAEYARTMFNQIRSHADMKRAINTWSSRDRLGDPDFPPAEETAPLQAADLLAHAIYLHMQERIGAGESGDFTRFPSGLARLCLTSANAGDLVYQNKTCLRKMLDQAKSLCPAWRTA